MVSSGRMTGEEVVGVLHAAAGVIGLLDGDEEPWWAIWGSWALPSG